MEIQKFSFVRNFSKFLFLRNFFKNFEVSGNIHNVRVISRFLEILFLNFRILYKLSRISETFLFKLKLQDHFQFRSYRIFSKIIVLCIEFFKSIE